MFNVSCKFPVHCPGIPVSYTLESACVMEMDREVLKMIKNHAWFNQDRAGKFWL
jgi:hypothetical protein